MNVKIPYIDHWGRIRYPLRCWSNPQKDRKVRSKIGKFRVYLFWGLLCLCFSWYFSSLTLKNATGDSFPDWAAQRQTSPREIPRNDSTGHGGGARSGSFLSHRWSPVVTTDFNPKMVNWMRTGVVPWPRKPQISGMVWCKSSSNIDMQYPLVIQHVYGKWPFSIGKLSINHKWSIFHSYVKLSEGTKSQKLGWDFGIRHQPMSN